MIDKEYHSGTVAVRVRTSSLSYCEWMVPSSNPGKGGNYFYSRVGDGGPTITYFDGHVIAINNYELERVTPFIGQGHRTINDD